MSNPPIQMRADAAYDPWKDRAREMLVGEMEKRKITYRKLAERLAAYGIQESPDQINRKVNRKKFGAAFLLACLAAMGVESLKVPGQLG